MANWDKSGIANNRAVVAEVRAVARGVHNGALSEEIFRNPGAKLAALFCLIMAVTALNEAGLL